MIQFLSILGGLASDWIKGKQDEAKAKQELRLRHLQTTENWESLQAQGSQTSFKDEWFTIILSIPMIGAFIPDAVPYIERGFEVLNTMPDYYKAFLGAAIAASFGIKALSKWGDK